MDSSPLELSVMDQQATKRPAWKKPVLLFLKLAFSAGMMLVIFQKVVAQEGAQSLWERLASLSPLWVGVAIAMQLAGIGFSLVRWKLLLGGQGIHAPYRYLFGSFMIARFFGAFTPGGFTGHGGYRIYDIADRTGKAARATATIGAEMILGQLAFGLVVMFGSLFGMRSIGLNGVLLVNGLFVALVTCGLTFLARPRFFLRFTRFLPKGVTTRVSTLVEAVCAYQGKAPLLVKAALLGVGTHACHNLVYLSSAHALGVDLSPGEIFFGTSLQIIVTMMPVSINGVGLREAAAVAYYTALGVSPSLAVLIPIVGFAAEMTVSSFGGLFFVLRRPGKIASIVVDDPDREHAVTADVEIAAPRDRAKLSVGASLGLSAGLLAGFIIGLGEGAVVLISSRDLPDLTVLAYGATAYALFCGLVGLMGATLFTAVERAAKRAAIAPSIQFSTMTSGLVAVIGMGLTLFRIRRDVFFEELVWKSGQGLLVLAGCFVAAAIFFVVFAKALRLVTDRTALRVLLRPWATPLLVTIGIGATLGIGLAAQPVKAAPLYSNVAPPAQAGPILFIVVDTLRADHLPAYGYRAIETPHLDAFAQDSVRFDQAFSNASWTRPSFASLLTGRYPSSHGVMAKSSGLADELVTMPEALHDIGYRTAGFVTNYNIAPFFNFHQGFDDYRYLEPEFVLGANDTAAKLLLVQFLRQKMERVRESGGIVEPGSAYRDAETVNREVFSWLGQADTAHPFFLFVAYMDPHDPYFEHPYTGSGYSRAANPTPGPDEAETLTRLYDGEIEYWDEHFGALVAELKRRGLYDRMTIVVTADHGEELMDHGGYWHGTTLYDEQVHVPLFVKLPFAQRRGTVVRHWVQSIDLFPTLARNVGAEVPSGVQGGDLFEGSDEIYAEESHEGNVLESLRTRRGGTEIKLITANAGNPRGLDARELYRVDQDPREQVNLASESREVLVSTEEHLDAHRTSASRGAVRAREIDPNDPGAAARLRALGYAGGDSNEH